MDIIGIPTQKRCDCNHNDCTHTVAGLKNCEMTSRHRISHFGIAANLCTACFNVHNYGAAVPPLSVPPPDTTHFIFIPDTKKEGK